MGVAAHCVEAGLVSVLVEKLPRFGGGGGAMSETDDMLGRDL